MENINYTAGILNDTIKSEATSDVKHSLNTPDIKIKGLSYFHRQALLKSLTECDASDEIVIEFNDTISLNRMSSLWYGGNMVDIKYKGYTFHIDASGDVYASLNPAHGENLLAYVKDKNNSGAFSSEMFPYFRSDKTLNKTLSGEHCRYSLDLHHNNWYECFITDPQNQFHDIMWALDDDNLFLCVSEVFAKLDETIKYLEENL